MLEALLLALANRTVPKGAFFHTPLPTSLANIVYNLSTKESATDTDVCTKLLNMYPQEKPHDTNKGFATTSSNKSHRIQLKDERIRPYCKSKGFSRIGHLAVD